MSEVKQDEIDGVLEATRELRRENYDEWMRNDRGRRIELEALEVKTGERTIEDLSPAPTDDELELAKIAAFRRTNWDAYMKDDSLRARELELLERRGQEGESQPPADGAAAPSVEPYAPESPSDYRFDYGQNRPPTHDALDASVRETFHSMDVPQFLAGAMYGNVQQNLQRFQNASEAEIQQHVESVETKLRQQWGGQFTAKVEAIDEMLSEVTGPLGEALQGKSWILADLAIMRQLDQVARHRARRGAGR